MKGLKLFCLFLIWALLLSWRSPAPVRAQTAPGIDVNPADSVIFFNQGVDRTTVQLDVSDAVDFTGFEVTLNYDLDVIDLVDWSYGDMLTNLFTFYEQDEPGSFTLACAQLSQPGVSGAGTILEVTFQGLEPGTSLVTIANAVFTDLQGVKSYPTARDGAVTVGYDPALQVPVPVSGEVSLQGRARRGGVPVTLSGGLTFQQGPCPATSGDQVGVNLDFGDVISDTYTLTTTQPRYLNLSPALGKTVFLMDEAAILSLLTLRAGNAVWTDNVIDAGDASLVGASYGLRVEDLAPGETLDGDVNFDGVVNLQDLALVAGNYGLTSAAVYEGWQP
jgi:hypothetical protein